MIMYVHVCMYMYDYVCTYFSDYICTNVDYNTIVECVQRTLRIIEREHQQSTVIQVPKSPNRRQTLKSGKWISV